MVLSGEKAYGPPVCKSAPFARFFDTDLAQRSPAVFYKRFYCFASRLPVRFVADDSFTDGQTIDRSSVKDEKGKGKKAAAAATIPIHDTTPVIATASAFRQAPGQVRKRPTFPAKRSRTRDSSDCGARENAHSHHHVKPRRRGRS